MAMTSCKECEKEISDKASICPNCGAPTVHQEGMSGCAWAIVVGLVFAVLIVALALIQGTGKPIGQAEIDAAGIAECQKNRDDPLQTVESRRLLSRTCEIMTEEYVQKYGRAP